MKSLKSIDFGISYRILEGQTLAYNLMLTFRLWVRLYGFWQHVIVKSWYEGNKNKWTGFNWLLPQCNNLHNQISVIKPSASASIQDIISFLCEKDLNLFVTA